MTGSQIGAYRRRPASLRQLEVEGFRYTRALSLARPKNIWRGRLARTFDSFLQLKGAPIHVSAVLPAQVATRIFEDAPADRGLIWSNASAR
jgi:hypothetical protein